MAPKELPAGLELQRVTGELDAATMPAGLGRAHRLAAGVWGVLRVLEGTLTFVWEDGGEGPATLTAGASVVIEPQVRHHVEPGPDARFTVEFHR